MTYTKCFEVWADNVFLGYEYGKSQYEVLNTARRKYNDPVKWNVMEYTTKQLTKENQDES
jgi:hypothetical protein